MAAPRRVRLALTHKASQATRELLSIAVFVCQTNEEPGHCFVFER